MSNDSVHAGWVQSYSLNHVWKLLDDLELEIAWMSRVRPDHDVLIRSCSGKERLLHARRDSVNFVSVERNGQV